MGHDVVPFMYELLTFFAGGKLPVEPEDTMEIMAMQEGSRAAMVTPEIWITLPDRAI